MPAYRILIFDANELLRWETVEAVDDIAAVGAAPPCEEADAIEVWQEDRRLATIRCR